MNKKRNGSSANYAIIIGGDGCVGFTDLGAGGERRGVQAITA